MATPWHGAAAGAAAAVATKPGSCGLAGPGDSGSGAREDEDGRLHKEWSGLDWASLDST